jgi:arylamine N-acetyltransferase
MASGLDLDAYLARIGEKAPLAPSLEGLTSLHRAYRDPGHPLEVLDGVFGLAFPPGTRFRHPEL